MPDFHHLLVFIAAGLLLNLTPGPDVMFIVAHAVRGGWRIPESRLHLLELGRQRAPFTHALHGLRHQLQLSPQRRRGFGPGVHTLNAPRPAA